MYTETENPQQLIAGIDLRNPHDVEFIGVRKNQSVLFLQGGQVKPFKGLEKEYYQLIHKEYQKDAPAQAYFEEVELLENIQLSEERKVELYTYFMWGDLDHTPDIIDGILQPSENFRDTLDCPSMDFQNKQFTIDGEPLTKRDLIIIDMSARECLDFEIADRLNIKIQTLDSHKTKLLKKTNCQSKLGLVSKSYRQHIIYS